MNISPRVPLVPLNKNQTGKGLSAPQCLETIARGTVREAVPLGEINN